MGPAGPVGPTGPAGSGSATVTVVATQDDSTVVIAVCAAGSHVVGGGGTSIGIVTTGGNASNLQASYPSDDVGTAASNGSINPPAWTARFFQANPNNGAWALCVPD